MNYFFQTGKNDDFWPLIFDFFKNLAKSIGIFRGHEIVFAIIEKDVGRGIWSIQQDENFCRAMNKDFIIFIELFFYILKIFDLLLELLPTDSPEIDAAPEGQHQH